MSAELDPLGATVTPHNSLNPLERELAMNTVEELNKIEEAQALYYNWEDEYEEYCDSQDENDEDENDEEDDDFGGFWDTKGL